MVEDQASGVPASFTTGERVKHLRERRGPSRPVLAGLAGCSADWLKKIENGQRGISIPALLRLAHVLDVHDLAAQVAQAWRDWHARPDNHSTVAAVLPGLVAQLERAVIVAEGVERRAARAAQAADDPVSVLPA